MPSNHPGIGKQEINQSVIGGDPSAVASTNIVRIEHLNDNPTEAMVVVNRGGLRVANDAFILGGYNLVERELVLNSPNSDTAKERLTTLPPKPAQRSEHEIVFGLPTAMVVIEGLKKLYEKHPQGSPHHNQVGKLLFDLTDITHDQ